MFKFCGTFRIFDNFENIKIIYQPNSFRLGQARSNAHYFRSIGQTSQKEQLFSLSMVKVVFNRILDVCFVVFMHFHRTLQIFLIFFPKIAQLFRFSIAKVVFDHIFNISFDDFITFHTWFLLMTLWPFSHNITNIFDFLFNIEETK